MIFPPVYSSTGGVATSILTLIGKIMVEKSPRAKQACHWCWARRRSPVVGDFFDNIYKEFLFTFL